MTLLEVRVCVPRSYPCVIRSGCLRDDSENHHFNTDAFLLFNNCDDSNIWGGGKCVPCIRVFVCARVHPFGLGSVVNSSGYFSGQHYIP